MLKKREPAQSGYVETVTAARARQLRLTKRNVNRLVGTYNAAAEGLLARLRGVPGHMIGEMDDRLEQVYIENILREVEAALAQFREMFGPHLRGSMLELAEAAAASERKLLALVGATPGVNDPLTAAEMNETYTLPDGSQASVTFGRVAHDAVEALATRYYTDGLRLSDRLYGVEQALRTGVEDVLIQATIEGLSVAQTMQRLVEGPLSQTAEAAQRAAVIARTELAHAYTEAHIRSTRDPDTGALREGVSGVKRHLSVSHEIPDICDIWALHDEGAGAGVYVKTLVPPDHPNGLCFTTTVLTDLPETAEWSAGKVPDLDGISDAHVQYYADRGDPVAQAFMAGA